MSNQDGGLLDQLLLRGEERARWWSPGAVLLVAVLLLAAVAFWVDLRPRVEGDFFFSSDDPQLRESAEIDAQFPSAPQVLVSAAGPDVRGAAYLERLATLHEALAQADGVAGVRSLAGGPASPEAGFAGPFWRRLLVPAGEGATYLLVALASPAPPGTIAGLEAVLARHARPDFDLQASGVPWVVELIRRQLARDLKVFTGSALLLFGFLVALVYRDWRITVGVLATCLGACAATLILLTATGSHIGALTANIITIVFVLTLSHLVYITANWRRIAAAPGAASREGDGEDAGPLRQALAVTAGASFWCMATTLLGFLSLLLASAKPLRELGSAGALGTLVAFAAAYAFYPPFLRRRPDAARGLGARPGPSAPRDRDPFSGRRLGLWVAALAVGVALAAAGLPRIDTDPGLLSYFAPGSRLRAGLEAIDAGGGSSPLRIVVRNADGERLDTEATYFRLAAAQEALDRDPAVGTALTLAALLEEAAQSPYARLLGVPQLVDLLASPAFEGAANSFVSADRERGVVVLRLREGGRRETRDRVEARLVAILAEHGFEPVLTGGLYQLQGQLSDLVASSLLVGLGGLGALFVFVAAAVSRSPRATLAMLLCLAGTPIVLFGVMGWAGLPVDFISSPAANVALGIGVDSMIHLASAARRLRRRGMGAWEAWSAARGRMWAPVLASAGLLALGFGLFVLSSFPPTQRFGIAVVIGLVAAAAFTLVALPFLATPASRRAGAETG